MGKKSKEIAFFIRKCRLLKLKLILSSFIKCISEILDIVIFVIMILFLQESLVSGKLHNERIVQIAILYVIGVGVKFFDTYFSHYVSYDVIEKLRDDIFSHYYTVSPGATENINTGDFVQMIVNDINVFEWFIAHILAEWMSVILLSLTIVSIITVKSTMTGIILSLFIVYAIKIFLGSMSGKEEQGIKIKNLGGDLISNVIDGISGFKELIFFDRDIEFFNKVQNKSQIYNEVSEKYSVEESKVNLKIDILAVILILLAILLLPDKGTEKLAYVSVITLYYSVLRNCFYQTGNFGFVFGALNRMKKVYDIVPIIGSYGNNEIDSSDINKGIEFKNCHFHYNTNYNKEILNGISFKANKGEKTVIVSASGGGKSTIFKLINRYYELNSGDIEIFGKSLKSYTERTLRKSITTFNQRVFFFNDTLLNNLRYANEAIDNEEIEKLAKRLNAYNFISDKEKCFDNIINEDSTNYSGGEMQRLAVLRGLIKDSPILLMDEVSSALDELNEKYLNDILDEMKNDKVIIIAAHKLSTIKNADKIILLKDGKVSGEGKYEELINNEFFSDLVRGCGMERER